MGGDGHDSAGAVAHHNVVGNIYRDLLAVDGVDGGEAVELDARLILDKLSSLKCRFLGADVSVVDDCVHVAYHRGVFIYQRMLGSHDHEGDAEEGVGSGRVYLELLVGILYLEFNERTGGFAYPVLLLELDIRQIVDVLEPLKELVGVGGDAQIPNVLGLLDYLAVADVALAALGILVGEDDLTARAVVDERLVPENEAVLKHLEEYPLCPLVVILLSGVDDL